VWTMLADMRLNFVQALTRTHSSYVDAFVSSAFPQRLKPLIEGGGLRHG
jgi:hypothetical protein